MVKQWVIFKADRFIIILIMVTVDKRMVASNAPQEGEPRIEIMQELLRLTL